LALIVVRAIIILAVIVRVTLIRSILLCVLLLRVLLLRILLWVLLRVLLTEDSRFETSREHYRYDPIACHFFLLCSESKDAPWRSRLGPMRGARSDLPPVRNRKMHFARRI
jgi:hypothetical protein